MKLLSLYLYLYFHLFHFLEFYLSVSYPLVKSSFADYTAAFTHSKVWKNISFFSLFYLIFCLLRYIHTLKRWFCGVSSPFFISLPPTIPPICIAFKSLFLALYRLFIEIHFEHFYPLCYFTVFLRINLSSFYAYLIFFCYSVNRIDSSQKPRKIKLFNVNAPPL